MQLAYDKCKQFETSTIEGHFNLFFYRILSPQKMLWALIVTAIGILSLMFSSKRLSKQSKDQMKALPYQTFLLLALIITTTYLLLYNFSSIAILLATILLSSTLIIIHASMRTRNLKNKITNKIDKVSMKSSKSPMGMILEVLHIRSEDFLN